MSEPSPLRDPAPEDPASSSVPMATGSAWAPRAGWRTLWLPLRAQRGAWLASLGVLVYYGATMARDLSFYDSGELALVAVQGGLGHPLGQPLHTWLGYLATRLPAVPPLLALNFLSALATALAVIPLVSLAEGMVSSQSNLPVRRDGSGAGEISSSVHQDSAPKAFTAQARSPWLRPSVLLPLGVGLVFVHPVLWENGTRVEVYALALVLGAWGLARVAATLAPRAEGGGGLFAAGVALGLAASANAYMATVVAVGLVPAVAAALLARRLGARGVLKAVGGGLVGLLPFVHLPLVAGRRDVFVWGAPTEGEALARYLSNADFAHNRGLSWGGFFEHLAQWSLWATDRGILPLVVLGLVAHGLYGRAAGLGRTWAALAFAAVVYFLCINVIFYPDVGDYLGYLSLPFGVLCAGVVALVVRQIQEPGRRRWLGGLLGLAVLGSLLVMPPPVWERSRHADRLARLLAQGVLDDAPPGSLVLVSSDHFVFPLLYLQEAEGRRPDVAVLPLGLSGASWYWTHLYRRHPHLGPFALRGSGGPGDPSGRVARVRRFLAANPDRPVLYEDFATAVVHGRPGCPGRWLMRDINACGFPGARGPDLLTRVLASQVDRLGGGSPPADAVMARLALQRGEVLWRYGLPTEALTALRAGVPKEHLPSLPLGAPRGLEAAGRLRRPPWQWKKRALIGHYSQNLFVAALLLQAAGVREEARAHLRAAALAGLPEAMDALVRSAP